MNLQRALTSALCLALCAAAPPTPFLCERYAVGCSTFLSSIGCTRSQIFGCGVSGNPPGSNTTALNLWGDNACVCYSPYYFDVASDRVAELTWDATVNPYMPSLISPSWDPPSFSPPISAVDTFSNVCATATSRLGCPVPLALNPATWQCECGGFTTGDHRAVEGPVDLITSVLALPSLPSTPNAYVNNTVSVACTAYNASCTNFWAAVGCTSVAVVGCITDASTFQPVCACNAPASLANLVVPQDRLRELVIDSRRNLPANLVPLNGGPAYDLNATYLAVCRNLLTDLGCPPMEWRVSGFSPGEVDTSMCTCGANFTASGIGFDATGRVAENVIDRLLLNTFSYDNYVAVTAALAATSCGGCDVSPVSPVDAAAISAVVTAGVLGVSVLVFMRRRGQKTGAGENVFDLLPSDGAA